MMNKLRVSERDDDLFSNEAEEAEENYINKKQLIHLENDKSVTIDDSMYDEEGISNRRSITPSAISAINKKKHREINPHEDLLKFINDTSDFFLDNTQNNNITPTNVQGGNLGSIGNILNSHNNLNNNIFREKEVTIYKGNTGNNRNMNMNLNLNHLLSDNETYILHNENNIQLETDKFEVFLPGNNNQIPSHKRTSSANLEKDRIFTLQSQSQSQSQNSFRTSNNYKEKFEFMEGKYKDLSNNYSNLVEAVKEWQMFYIKIFNALSISIPTDDTFNAIFSEKYKAEVVNLVEMMVGRVSQMEEETRKLKKVEGKKIFEIVKGDKLNINNTNRQNKVSIPNISISNSSSLCIISTNNSTHRASKPSPKNFKVPTDEYLNTLAPFSTNNLSLKKREKETFIPTVSIREENFELIPIIDKNKLGNLYSLEKVITQDFSYIHPKPQKRSKDTQTQIAKFDFDKLTTLNEEYSQQLLVYQKEKEEFEDYYTLQIEKFNSEIKNLREENKNLNKSILEKENIISNSGIENINLPPHPEMIPPEQTLQIFLHCVRHFKYEDEMYKKAINIEDMKSIRCFLSKAEGFFEREKDKGRLNSNINKFIIKKEPKLGNVSTKKFINDGNLSSGIKKVTSHGNLNSERSDNLILSKYKTMLKNITANKANKKSIYSGNGSEFFLK